MGKVSEFFEFSRTQLLALSVMALCSLVMGFYLWVRTYTSTPPVATNLPVILGDRDTRLVGYFVVDPNTTPVDSLELLPGIGKVMADRIVEYRQNHRFVREVDLTDVKGIGPKLFEQLRPYLKIKRP